MKEITLTEQKQVQINILNDIHEFCENNGIKYFLGFGTLLGAVRHKGFIPWDDDIDLYMRREEYERFSKLYNKRGNKRYCLINASVNPRYYHTYGKVEDSTTILIEGFYPFNIGLNVDIFILDGVPNNIILRKIQNVKLGFWSGLLKLKIIRNSNGKNYFKLIILKILLVPMKFIGINRILKKFDTCKKRYSIEKSTHLMAIYSRSTILYPKSIFEESTKLEFEGFYFCAPRGYDKCLALLYGDYMQLPPIEKRLSGHNLKAFIKY